MKLGEVSGWMRQLLMLVMAFCFIRNSGAVTLYSPQTIIKCEDETTDFDINCFPNVIHIMSSFFGRDDATTCTTAPTGSTTTMCSTTPAGVGLAAWMDIFMQMCTGNPTCNLVMAGLNSWTGATECVGVYKFLRVTYMCVTEGDTNPTPKPTTSAVIQQPTTPQPIPQSNETCICEIKGDPILLNYKNQALGLSADGVYYVSAFNNTPGVNCFFKIRAQIFPTGPGVYQVLKVTMDLDSGTTVVIDDLPPNFGINLGMTDYSSMVVGTTVTSGNGQLSVKRVGPKEVELFSGISWSHCPFHVTIHLDLAAPNDMFMYTEISKEVFGDGLWGLCGNCNISSYSYMTINQTMSDYVEQFKEP